MGGTSMTLEEALDRIDELEREINNNADLRYTEADLKELMSATEERICRRCYVRFFTCNDEQYCSRDCREFRRQEPFETLWKQLHPNGSREPNRTFAAAL